ncbi:hypothetical protein MBO12_00620 [Candidatus Saccharibacteria bacterium]|nr:hypothetical protein [Candidatus Saccharibacteria bacterium]
MARITLGAYAVIIDTYENNSELSEVTYPVSLKKITVARGDFEQTGNTSWQVVPTNQPVGGTFIIGGVTEGEEIQALEEFTKNMNRSTRVKIIDSFHDSTGGLSVTLEY